MKIDLDSSTAIYLQIAHHFRDLIVSGQLPPGRRLPPEREIAEEYRISRGTVRQAMNALVNEGLVERAVGKGTFVRKSIGVPTALIGVILPSTQDALAIDILGGVEYIAKQRDYHVVFAATENRLEHEAVDIQRMRRQKVAGLVVFPISNLARDEAIEALAGEGISLVLVDRYFPGFPTDVVTVDNVGGGYKLTRHLIDLSHRRIGFVTSDDLTTTSVRDRFQGYRRALEEHHLTYEDRFYLRIPGDLTAFLRAPDRPTAVFAANDFIAIEVMQVANGLGLRVPEDLAVVGFDDIREASQLGVPLTTIRQSGRLVGQRACALLLEQVVDGRREPKHEVLPVQLIVRRSCGAK